MALILEQTTDGITLLYDDEHQGTIRGVEILKGEIIGIVLEKKDDSFENPVKTIDGKFCNITQFIGRYNAAMPKNTDTNERVANDKLPSRWMENGKLKEGMTAYEVGEYYTDLATARINGEPPPDRVPNHHEVEWYDAFATLAAMPETVMVALKNLEKKKDMGNDSPPSRG